MMGPWIEKYIPKSTKEIVGQDRAISELRNFVVNFAKQKKKAALVYGPIGCGKSSAVYALASELNYELLEVNASDTRNAEAINSIIKNALSQRSFFFKGKIILIDEIDGLSGRQDFGGVGAIANLIADANFPIVMVANDPFEQKFSSLRTKSLMIEFSKLTPQDVSGALKNICEKEKIFCDEEALRSLARRVDGDLRAAVNDLQTLAYDGKLTKDRIEDLTEREREESITNALLKVFKTTDLGVAMSSFERVDEDPDKIILWLDENIPQEYEKREEIARAYHFLSEADIFSRRIKKRQDWRFLVYINSFLSAGVASAKTKKYDKLVKYKQTSRILKIWMANQKYAKRKAVAEKIGFATHSSSREAMKSISYFQSIFKRNKKVAETISEELGLSDDEREWMEK